MKPMGKDCRALINPPGPITDFNIKEPIWKEIQSDVMDAKDSCTPGHSGGASSGVS